jgi:tRNA pseudouridine13 synthase
VRAFLQIESDYRAMLLFTYQSYLWNEGVRRYLQLLLPREHLFPMQYQAGTLLFHRDASPEVLHALRDATFPLLGPDTTFSDPKVEEAAQWTLQKEKISLQDLRIEEASKLLFFKSEERPVLVFPHKLVLGKARPDDVNRGNTKVNVAFTLPPGAYATLVVKRLFHFRWREDTREEIRASQRPRLAEVLDQEERGDRRDERPSRPSRPSDRSPSSREGRPASSARPEGRSSSRSEGRFSARPEGRSSARPEGRFSARPEGGSSARPEGRSSARPERRSSASGRPEAPARLEAPARSEPRRPMAEEAVRDVPAEPARSLGFRDRQRLKKENRATARAEAASKPAKSQKKK